MGKRTIAGGLTLLVGISGVMGCAGNASKTTPNAGTSAVASTPSDAAAELAEAASRLTEDSFKTTLQMTGAEDTEIQMVGKTDPVKKVSELTMTFETEGDTVTQDLRMIGTDTYSKTTMAGVAGLNGKEWVHMDMSQATGPMALSSFDTAGIAGTLQHAADVQRVGDNDFKGTIDLTKAADALGVPGTDLSKLSTKSIPFEAATDEQGRLVHYKLDMPALGDEPAQVMDLTYSDFGIPVDVKKPPADEITEMPTR